MEIGTCDTKEVITDLVAKLPCKKCLCLVMVISSVLKRNRDADCTKDACSFTNFL